jgi:hypothetical protein
MSTSTDWASRPVPSAMSPEKLAALVDRSVSRTEGLLFTATPTEELDAIGRWQQLKDQAFAGQMREIVAAYNRAGSQEREFAADEVGLAVGAASTTGGNLVTQALAITALPGLLEAVEGGQLTERHVLAVLRELDKVALSLEQRHAVVLVMLARYQGQTPGELALLVARLIVQVDRAAAAARDAKATAGRKVWFSRDVDGQALVLARGPAAAIAAIRASLEATLPTETDPGDERSRGAREFDLFVDLLTGGAQAGSWLAEVLVPFSVAAGGELELAEIPGLGPILPSTARDLLDQADTIGQTAVDEGGQVIAVSDPIRMPAPVPAHAPTPADITADISHDAPTDRPTDDPTDLPTDRPAGRGSGLPRDGPAARSAGPAAAGRSGPGRPARAARRPAGGAGADLHRLPDPTPPAPVPRSPRPDLRVPRLQPAGPPHRQRPPPALAARPDQPGQPRLPVPTSPPRQTRRLHRPARHRRQLPVDQPRRLAVPPTTQGLLTPVTAHPARTADSTQLACGSGMRASSRAERSPLLRLRYALRPEERVRKSTAPRRRAAPPCARPDELSA